MVIGPGSLYTSVLAALAVPEHDEEPWCQDLGPPGLRGEPAAPASETAGYDVAAHLAALTDHGVEIDVVVADTSAIEPRRRWTASGYGW